MKNTYLHFYLLRHFLHKILQQKHYIAQEYMVRLLNYMRDSMYNAKGRAYVLEKYEE